MNRGLCLMQALTGIVLFVIVLLASSSLWLTTLGSADEVKGAALEAD